MLQNSAPNEELSAAAGIKEQFIQDYGQAYLSFGLPRLMGYIVGLLLYHDNPLSLTRITTELHVSKGPVSQIMRRLREHHLVEKVWVPGSRQDFYRATADIFGQAFANHTAMQMSNLALARKFQNMIDTDDEDVPPAFRARVEEMENFYTQMQEHLEAFLAEWKKTRN